MKFREIFRFEFGYQARRVRTWLYFAVLFFVAYQLRRGGVHCLFTVTQETLLAGLLWILMAPAVAGSAAARDVQTRMHPLVYTTPISKADYLAGRFLAAYVLNALILLALPLGMLTALLFPGKEPEIIGPFPPIVYFGAYGVLALPTAFTFTAVEFSFAALKRRAVFSYLGVVLFCVMVATTAAGGTHVFPPADPRNAAGSHRSHHSCHRSGNDTARDEFGSARTEELDSRQSTPLVRHHSGHARVHLPAVSLC